MILVEHDETAFLVSCIGIRLVDKRHRNGEIAVGNIGDSEDQISYRAAHEPNFCAGSVFQLVQNLPQEAEGRLREGYGLYVGTHVTDAA
ncbi:MAG: hypothetical protein BWY66_02803 [bacterium ADurb.Bin374]|nr:MAG: hypothetical protein BWY66_02803 [bacterium ADurb.Bin374]